MVHGYDQPSEQTAAAELAVKLGTIGAILLPAAAVMLRVWQLWLGGAAQPSAAVMLPIPELALQGLIPVGFGLIVAALILAFGRAFRQFLRNMICRQAYLPESEAATPTAWQGTAIFACISGAAAIGLSLVAVKPQSPLFYWLVAGLWIATAGLTEISAVKAASRPRSGSGDMLAKLASASQAERQAHQTMVEAKETWEAAGRPTRPGTDSEYDEAYSRWSEAKGHLVAARPQHPRRNSHG